MADFSSIEARVLSWIAGEQWRIAAFRDGKDIYCMSASSMFGVPVGKHGVNGHLRAKGKIAELACIAGGSLVLTERGLIPIEHVKKRDRVWDGLCWVEHDGVVFKGIRRILHYDGLSATEDHLVFVEGRRRPIPFGDAVRGRMPLRKRERKFFSPEYYTGIAPVYDILNAGSLHRFTVSGCLVHNCGYGGSVGAMKAMGAGKMGLSDEELQEIVTAWRNASPSIVKFWWDIDRAVMQCMKEGGVAHVKCVKIRKESGMLIITLPSGRELFYVKPRIGENKFGGECVTYEGREGAGKWGRVESYGPKFVENIIQGIARDILCYAMRTLRDYDIVAHIHDELVIEAPPETSLEEICELMGRTPPWAEGLLLRADGFVSDFYKKDD